MEQIKHTIDAPKTIRARDLINLLEHRIKEFGNLPVYITDQQGELAMSSSAIRFSDTLAFKKKRGHQDVMETYSGKFFILSDL